MNPRRALAVAALCALALVASGCFDPFAPRVQGRGISAPPPPANSPSGVLRLFEWSYNNRDYSVYRTLFTDDYRFAFSALDTAGKAYRGDTWTRNDELPSAQNLFNAASSITLQLDKSFAVFSDTRPGKSNTTYYRTIRTQVLLNIVTQDNNQINVQGKANFFLVRGDSAVIPLDLGFQPDSNRWYIDRWEDETVGSPFAKSGAPVRSRAPEHRALPAKGTTWCDVKALYR